MQKKGYIQIYTGDGKGKTTASLGLAMRALGHGWKVLIIQFTKNSRNDMDYGELVSSQLFPNLDIIQFGTDKVVYSNTISEEDKLQAKKGWLVAKEAISENKYNMIIMDELNVAMSLGLVDESDVVSTILSKPEEMEIVLTGRYAPASVISIAHLVTSMKPIKHYFDVGIPAREGIEY